ncbi:hypothetical protein [Enterobacter adelaidei]
MTVKEKIFYFWGVMDIIGAAYYAVDSWRFLGEDWGLALVNLTVMFILMWFDGVDGTLKGTYYLVYTLMPLMLLFSAYLYFTKKPYAAKFALAIEVLRIFTFRFSLPLLPVIANRFEWSGLTVNISLLVISELLKIGSLIFVIKKQPALN